MEVVELPDAQESIDELVRRGRAWSAIAVASHPLDMAERESENGADVLESIDVIALLSAALKQAPLAGEIGQMTGYYLGQILDYLTATDAPRHKIAGFAYYRLLEHRRDPVVRNKALATKPELFVDLVKRVYRGKNEPRRNRDAKDQDHASHAWWVLHGWVGFPGRRDDGTLHEEIMRTWVVAARRLLSDSTAQIMATN